MSYEYYTMKNIRKYNENHRCLWTGLLPPPPSPLVIFLCSNDHELGGGGNKIMH